MDEHMGIGEVRQDSSLTSMEAASYEDQQGAAARRLRMMDDVTSVEIQDQISLNEDSEGQPELNDEPNIDDLYLAERMDSLLEDLVEFDISDRDFLEDRIDALGLHGENRDRLQTILDDMTELQVYTRAELEERLLALHVELDQLDTP